MDKTEVIRQQMDDTRHDLTSKLEQLENHVVETVEGATTAVAETVETVQEGVQQAVEAVTGTVEDTIDTVKDAFDLCQQVERHPWGMMAAAAATGFCIGMVIPGGNGHSAPKSTNGRAASVGGAPGQPAYQSSPPRQEPGLLAGLADQFHDEIDEIKSLAIGAVMGTIREMLAPLAQAGVGSKQPAHRAEVANRAFGRQPV